MQNQINQTPITQFIQQVRIADQTQSKEVKLSIQQARALVLVLSEMQVKLLQDYETMFNELKKSVDTEVITVTMDGGGFEELK
jgi:hypothetical protein